MTMLKLASDSFIKKAKVPILIAKIYGTDKVLPKGAKRITPGKINVIFAKSENLDDDGSYEVIVVKIVERIKAL